MSQGTRKISIKSTDRALAAFIAKKAEIDTMLTRLQALSDDHFGAAPEETSAAWTTTPIS